MLSSHQQTIFRVWTSSRLLCMFLVYSIIRLFAQSGSHRRTCTWSRAQSHRDVIVLMRYLVLPRNPGHLLSAGTSSPGSRYTRGPAGRTGFTLMHGVVQILAQSWLHARGPGLPGAGASNA